MIFQCSWPLEESVIQHSPRRCDRATTFLGFNLRHSVITKVGNILSPSCGQQRTRQSSHLLHQARRFVLLSSKIHLPRYLFFFSLSTKTLNFAHFRGYIGLNLRPVVMGQSWSLIPLRSNVCVIFWPWNQDHPVSVTIRTRKLSSSGKLYFIIGAKKWEVRAQNQSCPENKFSSESFRKSQV